MGTPGEALLLPPGWHWTMQHDAEPLTLYTFSEWCVCDLAAPAVNTAAAAAAAVAVLAAAEKEQLKASAVSPTQNGHTQKQQHPSEPQHLRALAAQDAPLAAAKPPARLQQAGSSAHVLAMAPQGAAAVPLQGRKCGLLQRLGGRGLAALVTAHGAARLGVQAGVRVPLAAGSASRCLWEGERTPAWRRAGEELQSLIYSYNSMCVHCVQGPFVGLSQSQHVFSTRQKYC
jgi:hypothetical protein